MTVQMWRTMTNATNANRENVLEGIECPYCHASHAVKLWFQCGDHEGHVTWVDFLTTDPSSGDCLCNVYVCPHCGRVAVLDAWKEVANDGDSN